MVTDNVTGLVWQREAPSQGHPWVDAKSYCAGLTLVGKTGWRLPTLVELLSIVDLTRVKPAIDTTAFPNTPWDGLVFWASTLSASDTSGAWSVGFDGGGSVPWEATTGANWTRCRCVWTPLRPAIVFSVGAPSGQYTIAPETVRDNLTGLTWQRYAPSKYYDWFNAQDYCAGLSLGGFSSGWRLPTRRELESLVDPRVASPGPMIDRIAFLSASREAAWTSTTYAGLPSEAWMVWFKTGLSYTNGKGADNAVRCVH